MEEGLSFSVSSSQEPNRGLSTETLRPAFDLHAKVGQSSCQGSLHSSNKACNSEQFSETLSSLSLTSLLSSSSLVPRMVNKSNSTGSLARGKGGKDSKGEKEGSEGVQLISLRGTGKEKEEASEGEITSQQREAGLRKNR